METDTLRRIEIARVAAAHIEVRFWPSRRHEGRLNLVSERPYPWWTTAITHGGNTRRINADEFLERTGGNTPAYSDTIRATERWLPEIFFGLWLQIGDFLAHGRN